MLDILLRLLLAALAGGVVGYDRERHGRAAGLRTMLLTCVAAAAAAILAQLIYRDQASGSWHPDSGRIIQGVLAGIGFLGAGSIIREGNSVRGVTTAATLWLVTVLGLAIGSGYFFLSGILFVIIVIALSLLPLLERHILHHAQGTLTVHLAPGADEAIAAMIDNTSFVVSRDGRRTADATLAAIIEKIGGHVMDGFVQHDNPAGTRVLRYEVQYRRRNGDTFGLRLVEAVRGIAGVTRVEWA